MRYKHIATKTFASGVYVKRSVVLEDSPVVLSGSSIRLDTVEYSQKEHGSIKVGRIHDVGIEGLTESPFGSVVLNAEKEVIPLGRIYDYKVSRQDEISEFVPEGISFEQLASDPTTKEFLSDLASNMFSRVNPNTGKVDVDRNAFYSADIPLVVLSGAIPVQDNGEDDFFNPDGVVTVAEFLDSLNAYKYGSNANNNRKRTIDNISNEEDYFNEGYNACVEGVSSPFFNLYTREELMNPITRLELAYITVICWTQFLEKYNNLYGGAFYLGVNFDWLTPHEVLSRYVDGFSYRISKASIGNGIVSLDVKHYMKGKSVTEFKAAIKAGTSAIPLPMFMSMCELGVLDLFHYEDMRLDPMREVTRGEWCYFVSNLARLFPIKYFK